MDGAELDLNNSLSSSTKPTSTSTTTTTSPTNPSSSISPSDDYEKDLQLAAELGRCLLERNQELQTYVNVLQKQIDDEQCDIKFLQAKLDSTREQLEMKCKQTELLDATNFDLERELAQQRRDNERDRQHMKELADLCEKTRKQYSDLERDYDAYRKKQLTTQLFPKQFNSPVQTSPTTMTSSKLHRSHSFTRNSNFDLPSNTSTSTNIFDLSSVSVFQNHLTELKSRIHSLKSDCSKLNEQLHQSDEEKRYLIDRITILERERRDENDSLFTELNFCKKLLEKSQHVHAHALLSNIYSPPEHDVSLYDEVLFESKQSITKPSYEATNYKDLFARVYDKLKLSKS